MFGQAISEVEGFNIEGIGGVPVGCSSEPEQFSEVFYVLSGDILCLEPERSIFLGEKELHARGT